MSPRIVYQQGDHVCTLFSDLQEQAQAAIEYIKGGLAHRERCLYVCGEWTQDEFRQLLKDAGVDVAAEEARGALILITKHEGHLAGGSFSPAKMIELLRGAVKDALDAGFEGLRAAGDMNWVLDGAPGTESLAEYEALLNHFYRTNRALGLCQYNRRTLPAHMLDHCLGTHEYVRVHGPLLLTNPYYELPELAAMRTANPVDVQARIDRVSGVPDM